MADDPKPGPARLTIVPYTGHGNADRVVVRGRVLDNIPLGPATRAESMPRRLVRMIRRFSTAQLSGVAIRVQVGDELAEGLTDVGGYYRIEVPGSGLTDDRMFHPAIVQPVDPGDATVHTRPTRVAIPTVRSRRLVISDVDDTVMRSEATQTARLVWNTLSGSSWTRQAFSGTAELFAGLQRGPALDEENLIAYLSSSPWNLFDFLEAFLHRAAMPAGPLFLRGISGRLIERDHATHKTAMLREILEVHDLPAVLVGDTGQLDPEIYRAAIVDHPGRIQAVLLRHVSDDRRRKIVEDLYSTTDVPMAVSERTSGMAGLAEEIGLLAPGWTDRVAAYE